MTGRALGAALALVIVAGCEMRTPDVLVVEAERRDFERTLALRGRLVAARTELVRPGAWGEISFLVDEGTVVSKDDPLFGLETSDMEDNLEQKRLDVVVAEANLEKAVEDARVQRIKDRLALEEKTKSLELAELRARDAREDLENKRRQVEAQILPRKELPQAQLALQQAELNLATARIDLERLGEEIVSRTQTMSLDRRTARARVEKARSESTEAEEYLAKATAVAPRDGIVIHVKRWGGRTYGIGDRVGPHDAVMELPDLAIMEVSAEVNEVDIEGVEPGVPASVHVEAFPGLVLPGEVREVSGLAKEIKDADGRNTGVRAFEVVVGLREQDPRLRPGMSARIQLLLERLDDVIVVPLSAVLGEGESAEVVLASGERRGVSLRSSSDELAVVASGLEAGERVQLSPESGGGTEAEPADDPPEPAAQGPPPGRARTRTRAPTGAGT